ncbi:hypothetical protein NEISICOT_03550 [Neisseria sicca ATCC 29256]|uniref:Uncharacterized protein n=1 Tax=Neisseria sicca ATCC 29256 TaxID=547045 RepID=C6MAG8_NEISI|nr:hypothetical protein NEISICOT_03550 [Neisseria sicca ATCC 29256]
MDFTHFEKSCIFSAFSNRSFSVSVLKETRFAILFASYFVFAFFFGSGILSFFLCFDVVIIS